MTMTDADEITRLLAKVTEGQVKCPECGHQRFTHLDPMYSLRSARAHPDGRVIISDEWDDYALTDDLPKKLRCESCSHEWRLGEVKVACEWEIVEEDRYSQLRRHMEGEHEMIDFDDFPRVSDLIGFHNELHKSITNEMDNNYHAVEDLSS